ncbi:MAG: hypothetical protein BWX84_01523 [Verrucomicrobia bacterium ADurb.Bin118]|nr:MAG: hypothetical protein BWX84_01523 [Verrucomicrobia bacterium ADurb.Bin118]
MFPVVAGEFQTMLCAKLVVRPGPTLDEQVVERAEIVVPHLAPVADRLVQTGEVIEQPVTPALLELLRQVRRPRPTARGPDFRFVRKDAGHTVAKMFADLARIRNHRDLEKFFGDPRIQQIHITPAPMPAAVLGSLQAGDQETIAGQRRARPDRCRDRLGLAIGEAKDRQHFVLPRRRLFHLLKMQAAPAGFGQQLRHPAPCKTAGIRILIVNPDVHVEAPGLVESRLPQPEPVRFQIRRHQPGPRMYPDLPDILPGQISQGVADLFFGEQVVPSPERASGELARRFGEQHLYGRSRWRGRPRPSPRHHEDACEHEQIQPTGKQRALGSV